MKDSFISFKRLKCIIFAIYKVHCGIHVKDSKIVITFAKHVLNDAIFEKKDFFIKL